MNYEKIIVNASPLIALSKINELKILKNLFSEIIIPEAVYHEVITEGGGKTGVKEIEKSINNWIKIEKVSNKKEVELLRALLDYGEAEVIVLGKEINADLLIIDNKEPRLFAKHLNQKVIGTIGLILLAHKKGFIDSPYEKICELREKGFYLSDKLLKEIKCYICN